MPLLTRREITLLLFALTVFLVAYNFESSVPTLSLARSAINDLSASALLNVQNVFREDGRRSSKFADDLEVAVLGDWEIESRKQYDLGPGGVTEDQHHLYWGNGNIPSTNLVAHVPGYTILDNVLLLNGTLYLVSDRTSQSFPTVAAMLSTNLGISDPPVLQDLRIVTRRQAIDILGYDAHRYFDVASSQELDMDAQLLLDNQTFLALHRAYATLAESDTTSPPLVPPSLSLFPNAKRTEIDESGYSLRLARLAFPFMGHLFAEDWIDYERSNRPVIFDRILLADRAAAEHAAQAFDFGTEVIVSPHLDRDREEEVNRELTKGNKKGVRISGMTIEATDKRLSFAPAFALPAREDWAAPIREAALSLPSPKVGSEKRRAVTYVSTQGRRMGPRLRNDDHDALVRELKKLGSSQKWDVHIIEIGGDGGEPTPWVEHIRAAAQSSIMLGVYGDSLTNSILLRPGPPTPAVIEFFPDGRYTNEHEFVTRALGIHYVAWRNTKKFSRGSLPPISPPTTADSRVLSIDVSAVISYVKEQMKRS
ncbi:uncharacterized protein FOMMEDRAFT_160990 [Fomitiporia mediterranea MF3/22]|uniref:uncharacterized protein n=1 Tax=Fomitiporia mediterranea (strain MF3/22) TaxID=694068 RepID=UPI0004408828|nr:uncharacterized protein FOMMEDRAFT_160990 [Fomitiporia mediterranea MF3/22]EJC99377.1 hypothetical protein FOMMEDRAFT_160990 [Fomitiporia mediterranea MF3/22]